MQLSAVKILNHLKFISASSDIKDSNLQPHDDHCPLMYDAV
jgi:hypothetical protein